MKYQVKFSKINNNHNKLRDDEIIGFCTDLPEVEKQFVLFAPPRDQKVAPQGMAYFRMVNTSLIKEKSQNGKVFDFKTESGSQYRVEILEYLDKITN